MFITTKTIQNAKNVCIAYHRDGGEAFRQSDGKLEYNYTFDENDCCWYVEQEIFKRNTTAMTILEISSVLSYPRSLLLDEILKCDFKHWQADEYAENGSDAKRACVIKAKEAREKIIQEERAEREAYYRAYCD